MLTATEADHYRTFGFVTLRNYLSSEEVASITRELKACTAEAYEDRPFDGSNRHWVPLLTPKAPTFIGLAEERFAEMAEKLLDDEAVLLIADGNRYVGDTPWHADMEADIQGVKFAVYLDTVGAESGALRVIPGSHLDPLHSFVRAYQREHVQNTGQNLAQMMPAVALPSEPGDVVAFNPPIWHASVGGGVDRRMCTWNYFRFPRERSASERICEFTSGLARITDEMWPERSYPFYDEAWIANADGSAVRTRMIARMREAGILAAAGM